MRGRLAQVGRNVVEQEAAKAWPSPRWRDDPVGFARTILGVEPWDKQVKILELVRDNLRVAISSGHRIGKSVTDAIVALWYYSSFDDARVIFTSPSAENVDGVVYREVRRLYNESGRCVDCKKADPAGPRPCPHSAIITGDLHESAHAGLRSTTDLREIRAMNVRKEEAFQGIAGRSLLFVVDEASGVSDGIFEALEGNRAGGARALLTSNPTRSTGEFAEAFAEKADFYATMRVSSEESPNVVAGEVVVPGLATREWVEEKVEEWGRDSAIFKIRVLGQHVRAEEGAIFSVAAIAAAEARWPTAPESGPLAIGIDPAGESGLGDESAFAARRGKKLLSLTTRRGLSPAGHVAEALGIIADRGAGAPDRPRIVVDIDGDVGARVWGAFLAHLEQHPDAFDLVGVRSGERAKRKPETYDRVRDELAASLAEWMRDGGAIPVDGKLQGELGMVRWIDQVSGRNKITPKDAFREKLKRSPDRYDAVALSCWGASSTPATAGEGRQETQPETEGQPFDAYARDPFNPYG